MTVRINASSAGLTETVDTTGILEFQTANTSALVINASQNANFTSTGAITVPVGTTAQRPTATNGMIRYNTTNNTFEYYVNNAWALANVTPPPLNTVAPVISGSVVVGSNLTSTTGTWNFSPTSFAYQWRANAVNIIANATANVFTLTSTQLGANITCNVTAINAAGNSTPATSNTVGPVTATYSVNYLTVAGGGGGGFNQGGGGGAGGMLTGSATVSPTTAYTVTVGAGGGAGGVGSNSVFSTFATSVRGGNGGSGGGGTSGAGGSSGGAGWNGSVGAATAGQGNAGAGSPPYTGGGGGGAGGGGGGGNGTNGGGGGAGLQSSITGTATYYAGGGGGGAYEGNASGGGGGAGGGGRGGNGDGGSVAGSANTGGGGGAAGQDANAPARAGGSGIVIISYTGAQRGSGGTVTSSGGNTIHTFTTSGTYTA